MALVVLVVLRLLLHLLLERCGCVSGQNQKTGDDMESSAGRVNNGELALIELEAGPFEAKVCFNSDLDFGSTTHLMVLELVGWKTALPTDLHPERIRTRRWSGLRANSVAW